ncbi:ABC transporter ATP-binding protein [Paenibacillus sp. PL2-23]|uniref:ABC transporter ATP-binding protein n=1 Tax=Paenibacillus sp. PL2-23 TaxID=2100729 RepID=UPI0030FCFF09
MDIHEEDKRRNIKDGLLWRRMLAFARPYWRSITVSFLFALLIAATAVVQPLLVKSAIDDRIGGIGKPMVSTSDPALAQRLEEDERTYGSPVFLGDSVYYRAEPTKEAWLEGTQLAQIVDIESDYVLVEGWPLQAEGLQVSESGEGVLITAEDGAVWAGMVLTDEEASAFRKQDYTGFVWIAGLFLLSVIVSGLFTYWQSNLLQMTGQRIIYDLRARMFGHLAKLQTSYYDRNPVGRVVTRVAYDVEAINQLFSQVIVNLAKEALLLFGIAGIMLYLHLEMALVSFAVIPLLLIATFYFKKIIRDAQRAARVMLSRLNSFLAETLSGMSLIQMFTRESKQLEHFDEFNMAHYKAGMRGTVNNSVFNPLIAFLGNLALAIVVWYGGKSVLAAGVTFGVVYAFTTYVRLFFQPLAALSDRYTQIQTALASAERIFELLEEKPTIASPSKPVKLEKPLRGSIQFEGVWFAYEPDQWVLRDISFSAKPGETIAFVGATGAGKSSIIGLINRFYDIQKGTVRLDGIDLRELELEQLRTSIGVIQQDPFVFSGNVYDNIRMNRPEVSNEDIRLAVKLLDMEDFIMRLPQQYETRIGEQGMRLSSGQQQLLAFLRVFVSNPDMLILDEATAHVDTETEQTLQRGLMKLSQGRTTLIVAHRLSTIQHADRIIVMHKGRIQESGSHAELMKLGGAYRKLVELQYSESSPEAPAQSAQ